MTASDSRSGMVMMAMMILFGSITLLSVGAFIISSTDVLVAGQYVRSKGAFFQAEGGLQAMKAMINDDLADGTLTLTNTVMTVNYSAPAGFKFDPVTALIPLAKTDSYYFTITGRTVNAETVIEATFERLNKLVKLGIFGDDLVRGQPNGGVYSYYSETTPTPTIPDSTDEAAVGSNNDISLKASLDLDGHMVLGQDSLGNDATFTADSSVPYDYIGKSVESDPLGAVSGELAAAGVFFSNSANNNNADATPPIINNRINGSVSLPPGNYYLEQVRIGALDVLEVGGTQDNPVRIYLGGGGEFRMQPNSEMVFTAPAVPPAFQLFALNGNNIRIQPNLDFWGLIYAPDSDVQLQPNGSIHGIFWGDEVLAQPGGDIWIDLSLLDGFLTSVIEYTQWKEIRTP
jgi:hypothetical protein